MISDEASVVSDPNIVITDPPDLPPARGHPGTEIGSAASRRRRSAARPRRRPGTSSTGSRCGPASATTRSPSPARTTANAADGHGDPIITVTTLNTGLGNDHVDVTLTAGQDGFFVVNTQGPYDQFPTYPTPTSSTGRSLCRTSSCALLRPERDAAVDLPLISSAARATTSSHGGPGSDTILGDRGRVLFFAT